MTHRAKILALVIPLITFLTLLGIWEGWVRGQNYTLIPAPSASLLALGELTQSGMLADDLSASIRRVLIGLSIAIAGGITLGIIFGLVRFLQLAFAPILELLRPIPPIAWIPLSMTIFGLGDPSACFVIFIGAFHPILTSTTFGIKEVPSIYLDVARTLGASSWRTFIHVVWPSALPSIFSGLRIAAGFAWMCVVAAEMIAARSGLGYEIQLNRQLLCLDRVVAGMLVIGFIGFLMNWLLFKLERKILPWKLLTEQKSKGFIKMSNSNVEIHGINHVHSQPTDICSAAPAQGKQSIFQVGEHIQGAAIQVNQLRFGYSGENPIIENFQLNIKPGEILCLLGESGCGKTSLLRLLGGFEKQYSGLITIDNAPLAQQEKEITMIFQQPALFPWLTTEENVSFGLHSRNLPTKVIKSRATQFLQLVGLADKLHLYPEQLSGGQQQRIALARALAYKPRLLLMDEPFTALDGQTREKLQEEISAIITRVGITAILVTHDIREAIFLADRVAALSPKSCHIVDEVTIGEKRPRQEAFRYTKEFSETRARLWSALQASLTCLILVIVLLTTTSCNRIYSSKDLTENKSISPLQIIIGWQTAWAVAGQLAQTLEHTNIPKLCSINLELKGFLFGPEINEAALNNQLNCLNTGLVPTISLLSASPNWIVIARLLDQPLAILAAQNSHIKSLRDLKSKTLGVPFGSGPHAYVLQRLQEMGLEVGTGKSQVHLVNLSPTEQPIALAQHSVDALGTWEPQTAITLQKHLGYTIDHARHLGFIVIRKDLAEKYPTEIKQMLKAYLLANYFVAQHPKKADQWFMEKSHYDRELLNAVEIIEPNMKAKSLANVHMDLGTNDLHLSQEFSDTMYKANLIPHRVNFAHYVNTTYLQEAEHELEKTPINFSSIKEVSPL